jgi:hypothetical protein
MRLKDYSEVKRKYIMSVISLLQKMGYEDPKDVGWIGSFFFTPLVLVACRLAESIEAEEGSDSE